MERGKKFFARYIHGRSERRGEAFIAVHCASLNPNLLESELFGHTKGAFTGAISDKKGRFQEADKGTLFLDEIGEVSLAVQIKLLRVLETRTFERVGGIEPISVDIRIIAATNQNLELMVREGAFREDLYYRLNVIRLELPTLRERVEDIIPLTKQFIKDYNELNKTKISKISSRLERKLLDYAWKGNVRELKNVVEKLCILSDGEELSDEHFPDESFRLSSQLAEGKNLSIHNAEKQLIIDALRQTNNNKSLAAEKLQISRRTLYRKIEEYGIK